MIAARLQNPLPAEPFADDAAGLSYFVTDFHYEYLVARLRRHLAATRGFYLVSGTPAPDGELVERAINGRKDAPQRATLVRCRAGITVDAVTRAYARQLGLTDERDNGQWSLLSRLMEDSRKGVMRVLVLENADALDDRGFDELHRFATLDDPHFLPVVLLTQRSFAQRLDAPSLQFLQPAIVAHLALQQLETEEVAAFIRYQLNATEGRHERVFTREVIAAIAAAAKGDPAAVNRLARQAAGIATRSAPPAAPAAPRQLVVPAPKPLPTPAPAKIEPRLTLRPGEPARPAASQPIADKAPPLSAPSTPKAAAVPTIPPAGAAARKSTAPVASLVVASMMRARAMAPAATIAAYVVLAAASAAALFYLLAPGAERGATVVAEAPQVQTVFTGDLPLPSPRRVKPAAAEALPAIPAVPQSVAADPPPAAPEPPAAAAAPAPNVPQQAPSPPPAVTAKPVPALAAIEPTAGAEPPAESVAKAEPAPPPPTPAPGPSSTMATPSAAAAVEAPPSALATSPGEIVAKAESAPLPPSVAATPPAASVAKIEADPAPLPPRAADNPPSGAAAALVRRGEALLASGDITSARQFFARAAETGDAAAACGLGKSYDPLVLRQVGTRGVAGDPAKAADWYRRAARAGSNEAAARLARLLVKFPQ